MIVGVTGLAGSGKDTFARRLIERHGYTKHSFARALKVLCSAVYGWELDRLEELPYKEQSSDHGDTRRGLITREGLNAIIVDHGFGGDDEHRHAAVLHLYAIFHAVQPEWSRRRILQWIGTEGFRAIDTDYWVKLAMKTAPVNAVFTDVRFDNEAEAIIKHGGVVVETVKIGQERASAHASEAGISPRLIRDRFEARPGDLEELHRWADWLVVVGK